MKKKYRWLKIKLISMFVVIYLFANFMLLEFEAKRVTEELQHNIIEKTYLTYDLRRNNAMESDDFIQQAYEEIYHVNRYENVGFYTMLMDREGNKYAEDQNFIIVEKAYGFDEEVKYDRRVLLLGDDRVSKNETVRISFEAHNYSQLEIIGKCDDTYIYLDELKWLDDVNSNHGQDEEFSYIPKEKQEVSGKELVDFETWSGSRFYSIDNLDENKFEFKINITGSIYGNILEEKKLNSEAEERCHQLYEDFISGKNTNDLRILGNGFTYYIVWTGYLDDTYVMPYVFVFHPYSIAFENYFTFFIISFIIGYFIVYFIYTMIDKMYKQQEAYESNRQSLTRSIAHELKTPLAITKGYVENWEYIDDKDRTEAAGIMIEEIDHMNKMVMDLLELSHLEAKVKKVNLEHVDIHQLTISVLKRMEPLIQNKNLEVILNAGVDNTGNDEDKEYLVEADLAMMRTVLENFISNAVKYAYKKVNITISEKGRKVRFEIANRGNEISIENVKNIWNEFYRTEHSEESRTEGTGLGLAITKNILELHNAKYGYKRINGENIFWFEMKSQN